MAENEAQIVYVLNITTRGLIGSDIFECNYFTVQLLPDTRHYDKNIKPLFDFHISHSVAGHPYDLDHIM